MEKVRKFFWFMAFGGMFSVFMSFANPTKIVGKFLNTNMGQSIVGPQTDPVAQQQTKPAQPEASELVFYNNQNWVFIQGKYYPYSADNIYYINGIKTFYKARLGTQADNNKPTKEREPSGAPAVQEVSGMDAYGPGGMAQMMNTLKEAKKSMEERNAQLKELAE